MSILDSENEILSTKENLINGDYTDKELQLIEDYTNLVQGDSTKIEQFKKALKPVEIKPDAEPRGHKPPGEEKSEFVSTYSPEVIQNINLGLDSLLGVQNNDYRNIGVSVDNPLANVPTGTRMVGEELETEVKVYDRPEKIDINEDNIDNWLRAGDKYTDEYFDNYIKGEIHKNSAKQFAEDQEFEVPSQEQVQELTESIRSNYKFAVDTYRKQIEGKELQNQDLNKRATAATNQQDYIDTNLFFGQAEGSPYKLTKLPKQQIAMTAYEEQLEENEKYAVDNLLDSNQKKIYTLQKDLFETSQGSADYYTKQEELNNLRAASGFGGYMYDSDGKSLRKEYTEEDVKQNIETSETLLDEFEATYDIANPADRLNIKNLFTQNVMLYRKYKKQKDDMTALLSSSNIFDQTVQGLSKEAISKKLTEANKKLRFIEPRLDALNQYYLLNNAVLESEEAQSRNEYIRGFGKGFVESWLTAARVNPYEASLISADVVGSRQAYDDAAFNILQELGETATDAEVEAITPKLGEELSGALGGLTGLASQLAVTKRVINPVFVGSARVNNMVRTSELLKKNKSIYNALDKVSKTGLLGGWYSKRVTDTGKFVEGLSRFQKAQVIMVEGLMEEAAFSAVTGTDHLGSGFGFGVAKRIPIKIGFKPKNRYKEVFNRAVAPHLGVAASGTVAMELAELGHSFAEIVKYDDTFKEKFDNLYGDFSEVGKRIMFNMALNSIMSFSDAYNPYSIKNTINRGKTFNKKTGEYGVSGLEFAKAKWKASFSSRRQQLIDLINDFNTNPAYQGKGAELFAKEIAEARQALSDIYNFEINAENSLFGGKLVIDNVNTPTGKSNALNGLKRGIVDAANSKFKGYNLAIKQYVSKMNEIYDYLGIKTGFDAKKINDYIKTNGVNRLGEFMSKEMAANELNYAKTLKTQNIVYHEPLENNFSFRVKLDKATGQYNPYFVYRSPSTGRLNKVSNARAEESLGRERVSSITKYADLMRENASLGKNKQAFIGSGDFTGAESKIINSSGEGPLIEKFLNLATKNGLGRLARGLSAVKKLNGLINEASPLQYRYVFHRGKESLESVISDRVAEKRRNAIYKFNTETIDRVEFQKEMDGILDFAEKALTNSFVMGSKNTIHIDVSPDAKYKNSIEETIAHEFAHPLLEYIKLKAPEQYAALEQAVLNNKRFRKEFEWAKENYGEKQETADGDIIVRNESEVLNETMAEFIGKEITKDQLENPIRTSLKNAYKKIIGDSFSDIFFRTGKDLTKLSLEELTNPETIVNKINNSIRLGRNLEITDINNATADNIKLIEEKNVNKQALTDARDMLKTGLDRGEIMEKTGLYLAKDGKFYEIETIGEDTPLPDNVKLMEAADRIVSNLDSYISSGYEAFRISDKNVKTFEDFENYAKQFTSSYFITGRQGSTIGTGVKADPETAKLLQATTEIMKAYDNSNVEVLENFRDELNEARRIAFQGLSVKNKDGQPNNLVSPERAAALRKIKALSVVELNIPQVKENWQKILEDISSLEKYGRKTLKGIKEELSEEGAKDKAMALAVLEGDGNKKGRKTNIQNAFSLAKDRNPSGGFNNITRKALFSSTHNIYSILEDLSINDSSSETFKSPLVLFAMDNLKGAEKTYYVDKNKTMNIISTKLAEIYGLERDGKNAEQVLAALNEKEFTNKTLLPIQYKIPIKGKPNEFKNEVEEWTKNEAAKLYIEAMDPSNFQGLETNGIMKREKSLKEQFKSFEDFAKSKIYEELEIDFSFNPYFNKVRSTSVLRAQRISLENYNKNIENVNTKAEQAKAEAQAEYENTIKRLQEVEMVSFGKENTSTEKKTAADRLEGTLKDIDKGLKLDVKREDKKYNAAVELIKNKAKELFDADAGGKYVLTDKGNKIIDLVKNDAQLKEWADFVVDEFFPRYVEGTLYEGQYGLGQAFSDIYNYNLPTSKKYSPVKRVLEPEMGKNSIEVLNSDGVFATATNSHFKEKTQNKMGLEKQDINQVLLSYVHKMEFFKAYQKPLNKLTNVFSDLEVRKKISEEFDPAYNNEIDIHLNEIAGKGIVGDSAISMIEKIRRNYIVGSLGLKPSLFFKQLTSTLAYQADMPSGTWWKEFAKVFPGSLVKAGTFGMFETKQFKEAYDTLMDLDFMKKRYAKLELDDALAANMSRDIETFPTKGERRTKQIVNSVMTPVVYGDRFAIILGGWPLYKYTLNKALSEGKTEAEAKEIAVKEFERTTALAQQASEASDLSRWQRSPIAKYFTMYKTTQMSYFRHERAAFKALAAGKGDMRTNVKKLLIYHILLPQLFQGVTTGFKAGVSFVAGDDEKLKDISDSWASAQKRALVLGSLNGPAIYGDILTFMLNYAIEDKNWGYKLSALESGVEDVVRSSVDLLKTINKYGKDYIENGQITAGDIMEVLEDVDSAVDPASTLLGLPYRGIRETGVGLYHLLNKEEQQQFDPYAPFVKESFIKE